MDHVAAEALEVRFARESEEVNLRRARVMIALVLVVHVGVVVFGTAPAGELEASARAWFDMLVLSHEVMCGVAGTLLALCLLPGRLVGSAHKSPIGPIVGELTYAAYLAMGVASSLNDQRQFASNINAYVIAVLVPPLVFRLRFGPVVVVQAIAMTVFLVLLPTVQPSEAARLSVMVIVPIMDRVLSDGRALSPAVACRVGAALSEALAAAHAKNVVHRDVKPANILLTETSAGLKLLDFGISKMREARGEHATLTEEGLVVGTPAFMAPEQITEPERVGDRTDVYAAGLVVYHALAGRSPFAATSASLLLVAQVTVDPEPLASLVPSLPDSLGTLVHRALSKSASERPSAEELARALSEIADSLSAPPLPELVREIVIAPPRPAHAAEISMMATRDQGALRLAERSSG